MPRESAIPIDLPSLDDLFTTQAERDEVGCEKVGVIPHAAISFGFAVFSILSFSPARL